MKNEMQGRIIEGWDAAPETTTDAILTAKELKAARARANGRLGGRPRKPVPEPVAPVAPPTTSSEVDALIATELVKPEPRFKAIRALESLRESLKQAEAQARTERERAEHEQRRVAAAAKEEQERAQRKAAYKARMDKKNGTATDTADAEVQSLTEQLTADDATVGNLREQLTAAQSILTAAQSELATTKADLNASRKQIQTMLAEDERMAQSQSAEIQRLNADLHATRNLAADLTTARATIDENTQKMTALREENVELTKELTALIAEKIARLR